MLAPLGVGGAVETHVPLASDEAYRWTPQIMPVGPLTIVVSQSDGRVVVMRNGVEIGRAKAHGLQAGAGGCDFLDMGDARGRFDDDFEGDGFRAAFGAFDGGHQSIDGIDIFGATDLWNHDHIQPVAGLFQ